jgi:hypothetical protein
VSPERLASLEAERPIWPEGQDILRIDPAIAMTRFEDLLAFHDGLVDYLIACEREKEAERTKQTRGAGGTKIYHVDSWPVPGARLLDQRAQALYREIVGQKTSAVDLSWGNVYRAGDYILPHAHRRSHGSVLYMLSMGDRDEADPLSGRFGFADPRLPMCCREAPEIMTSPHFPPLRPGSMLVFPSTVVHFATPYRGEARPRITISWNINKAPLADRPADDAQRGIAAHPDRG